MKISFYISPSALDDELLHGAELRLYRHPTSSSSSTSSSLSSSSSSSSSLSSSSSDATSLYPTSFDNSVQRRRHRRSANVTLSSSLPSSLSSSSLLLSRGDDDSDDDLTVSNKTDSEWYGLLEPNMGVGGLVGEGTRHRISVYEVLSYRRTNLTTVEGAVGSEEGEEEGDEGDEGTQRIHLLDSRLVGASVGEGGQWETFDVSPAVRDEWRRRRGGERLSVMKHPPGSFLSCESTLRMDFQWMQDITSGLGDRRMSLTTTRR